MPVTAQSTSIFIAMVVSYLWVTSPELQPMSLQLIAGLVLTYFIFKRAAKSHWLHVAPSSSTLEIAVFSTMLFVVVGYTGGIGSIFLPLLYLLVFVSVIALHSSTLFLLEFMIPLYLWAIAPHALSTHELATLLSFPVLLPLFAFAKFQYIKAQQEKTELGSAEQRIESMMLFITTFLKPKLETLAQLGEYPVENAQNIQKQIRLIQEETQDLAEGSQEETV